MFTKIQSGFLVDDSCISQLLSLVQEVYISSDCNAPLDLRGTFLDISESLDKFWYEWLILKLQTYGIKEILLNLMQDCSSSRQQQVILNGQTSSSEKVLPGVPQGSVLGSLLVLIYINNILKGTKSICKIFRDLKITWSMVWKK